MSSSGQQLETNIQNEIQQAREGETVCHINEACDSNSNCRAVTHSGTTVNVEVELEPETELNEDVVRLSETKQEAKGDVSTSKEDCRGDKHCHVMIEGNGISAVSSNKDQVIQKSANGDEVESQAIDVCVVESRQTVFNRDSECIQKQISLESNSTSPIATASAMCSALQKDQTDEVINDISSTTTAITPHKLTPGKAISVRATEKVNEKKEPELSYECQPHAMLSKNLAIVTHGAEKWLEGTVQTVENVHFLDSSNFSNGKSTASLPTTNLVSSTPHTGGVSLDSSSTAAMKFTPCKPTLRDAVPLKVVKPNSTANDGDDLQVTGSKSKKSKQKSGLKIFTRSTTRQTAVDKATTPSCQPVITKDVESSTSSEGSCHTSNHDDIPVPVAHSSLPACTLQEDHIYEMIPGSIIESGIRLTPYQPMLRTAASVRPKKTEVSSKTQKQPTVISMSRSQDQVQPWRKTFKTKEELRKQYKCRKLSGKLQIVHQPLQNPYHESVNECGTSDTIHEQDIVHSEHGSQNDDSDVQTPYHPYQPLVFTHEAVNSESYQNVIIKPYLTKTAADQGHLDENEDGVNTPESQHTAKILEESDNGLRPSMYTDQDTVLHESSTDSTENQSISKSSIEEGYPNTSELAIEETQMVSHDPAVESSQYGAGECTPTVKKDPPYEFEATLSEEFVCDLGDPTNHNTEQNTQVNVSSKYTIRQINETDTNSPHNVKTHDIMSSSGQQLETNIQNDIQQAREGETVCHINEACDSNSNCRAVTHSGTTVNVEVELDHQMSLQRCKSENVGMCAGGDSNSNCRAVTHSGTTVNVEVELEPETELNEDVVRLSETKQEAKDDVSTSKEDCRGDKHCHVMIEGNGISAVSSNEDQVIQKSANGDEVESQAIDVCAVESQQTVFNRDGECIQKQISLESNSTSPIATASAMCSALQKDQTDEVINDISSTTTAITPHKLTPGKAISVRATEKVNEKKEPELSYECQPHAMLSKNLAIVTHGAEKWLEGTVQTVENVHFLDSSNFSNGKSTASLPTTNLVSSTPHTGGVSLDSSSTAAMKFTPCKPTLRDAVPLKVVKPNSTANDGDDVQVTGSKSKKSKQKSGLKMFTRSTTRQTAVDKVTTPSCQPVITKDGESSTPSQRSCHASNHDDIPVPVAHSSLPAWTLQEDHIYEMIPGSIIESGIRLTPYQPMLRTAASVRPKKTEVSSKTQKQPTVISMSRSQDQVQPWRKTFKTKEELRKQYKCRKLSGKLQIVHQPLQNPYHESINECGTSDTIHEQDLVHSEHGSQNDDSDVRTPYHPYQPLVFTHEAVNSESYQNVIIKPYLTKTAADRGHLDENEDGENTPESQQTAKILEESDNGLRPSMYTDQDTVLHESSTDSTENQSISKSSIQEGYPNTSELAIEETQMVSHDPAVESSQYGAGECTPSKRFDGECVKKSSEHYVNLSLSTEKKCTILVQNSERNEEACDEMEFEDLLTNSTDQPLTNKCKCENVSIPSTDRKIEHHPAPYLNMTILLPPKTRANQGQLDQDEDTGPRDCSEFKQDVQKFPKCEERTHSQSTDHDSELKELGIIFTEDDSVGRSSIQCHDECPCMPEEPFQVYQLHENSHRPDFKSSDLCGTGKDLPTTVQGSHEKKSSSLYANFSLCNTPDKEKESHLCDVDVLKNPGKEEEEVHSEKEFHLLSERDRQSAKGLKYEIVSISSADEQQNTVKKDLPYEFEATLSEEFVCDLGDSTIHNTGQNTQVNVSKCAKVQTRDVVQHRIMNEYSVDS